MTICHTPGCPAAHPLDEFGRRPSVMHNSVTQSVLGSTGHHLLNRAADGTLDAHLASWKQADVGRALDDVQAEMRRVQRYGQLLEQTAVALLIAEW